MFSPQEEDVLKIIGRKKITIAAIAKVLIKVPTVEHSNSIAGCIRRINRKCLKNKLDWMIDGEGMGRQGRTVWKIKV